jgi:hypothetical protein
MTQLLQRWPKIPKTLLECNLLYIIEVPILIMSLHLFTEIIHKDLKGDISIIDEKREGYHLLGSLSLYLSFLFYF